VSDLRGAPLASSHLEQPSRSIVDATGAGEQLVAELRRGAGTRLRSILVGNEALRAAELARPDDLGLHGPNSVIWYVHAESAMLVGGLRALMLQTLHPLAMAGVSDHSDYRKDPWGRLRRTSRFVAATTYGSTATAEQAIATVRRVHERVVGTAPDGRPYSANDPHLLLWVHVTEVDSFLRAVDRFGELALTDEDRDRYVAEMAAVAHRLGSEAAPRTQNELATCLADFRSECRVTGQAREAVRFLIRPPVPLFLAGSYALITSAALTLLPVWARQELRLPIPPGIDRLAVRPSTTALMKVLSWLLQEDSSLSQLSHRPPAEPLAGQPAR
jgi:uncharacterized protein (DUF2236 family)